MQRKDLEGLSREELIARADAAGVVRPRSLTIPELIDDILKVADRKSGEQRPRGWFGRARDLLTSVIDRGMGAQEPRSRRTEGRPIAASPPPLPTVTLAEIYAAQGHTDRAIATLDEVLAKEPTHVEAQRLRQRFSDHVKKTKPSTPPPLIEPALEPVVGSATSETEKASGAAVTASAVDAVRPPEPASEPLVDADVEADTTQLEVDEIVALAVDPTTVYLYWEVRPMTLARARAEHPDGALVVRAASVVPRNGGAERDVRDVRVDALFGELFIHGMAPQANVRVSIGYKHAGGFEPFAVGIELSTPRLAQAREVSESFRRFSDPQASSAQLPGSHRAAAPFAKAGGHGAAARTESERDALLSQFPAGVWVDPKTRVVIQTDMGAGPSTASSTHPGVSRTPGSSDLVRRGVVWASSPSARP